MVEDNYTLSVIIPTFNEAENIAYLIEHLQQKKHDKAIEIIITDGHSTDNTVEVAAATGATVIISPYKGRACQMNYGALHAKSPVLYFLHADSFPPDGFVDEIVCQLNNGYTIGCFRLAFDINHWFLKANAWFTRFDYNGVRFGDQSLFVSTEVFTRAGGFNEKLVVMEDQEIIHRLKRHGRFKVMHKTIVTSARKYRLNGVYKMQGIFFLIYFLYKTGMPQNKLKWLYRRFIKQDKV